MNQDKINAICYKHLKNLPNDRMFLLSSSLKTVDDRYFTPIMNAGLLSVKKSLLLSIFLGKLGADRFYIGSTGLGIVKLLFEVLPKLLMLFSVSVTLSAMEPSSFAGVVDDSLINSSIIGLVIWCIVSVFFPFPNLWSFIDIFVVHKKAREKNFDLLYNYILSKQDTQSGSIPTQPLDTDNPTIKMDNDLMKMLK